MTKIVGATRSWEKDADRLSFGASGRSQPWQHRIADSWPQNREGMDSVVFVALCYNHPHCFTISADPIRNLPRTERQRNLQATHQRTQVYQVSIQVSPERLKEKIVASTSGWSRGGGCRSA